MLFHCPISKQRTSTDAAPCFALMQGNSLCEYRVTAELSVASGHSAFS